MREHALNAAKNLVYKKSSGVMSTLSHNLRGYPFGSVTPYMCDEQGRIYFFISDIAQHTKNLTHDGRMSLTVYDEASHGDQNEHGRVTIVGDGSLVAPERQAQLTDKYVALFPDAQDYRQAHDFNLWQLDPIRVRFIGGFGKIFWLEQQQWQTPAKPWDDEKEQDMIEHMNRDHQDAMSAILKQHANVDDTAPIMSGLLPTGCYIQAQQRNHYIAFESRCDSPDAVRQALVSLTKQARSAA